MLCRGKSVRNGWTIPYLILFLYRKVMWYRGVSHRVQGVEGRVTVYLTTSSQGNQGL